MENILNKDIRAVIDQCPEVGRILEEYNIGCAPRSEEHTSELQSR